MDYARADEAHEDVTICPCCGQEVEGNKFLADPSSNTITNGKKTVRFSTQQFKVAAFLIKKFPMLASKEAIYDGVFLDVTGNGPDMKIVDVQICKVRPLLAELGLVIETVWAKGYRIVQADAEQATKILESSVRRRSGAVNRWTPDLDEKLIDLMRRKFTKSQCAATLRKPYMMVERNMKRLQSHV